MVRFPRTVRVFALIPPTRIHKRRQGPRRHWTTLDAAQTPVGCGATVKSRRARCITLTLSCLFLFALVGSLIAKSALATETHPFKSQFTGIDTPQGSLGTEAEKLAIRQSNGDVYVIASSLGVVDIFDDSGTFLSQVGPFGGFGGDPDLAVDNSGTASEGNLYVLPEFGPLSAFDSSGTLLYQLNGSNTPIGSFGDVCGTAVDSSGNLYVADFSNSVIQKFDSAGNYLASISLSFTPCDIAVDTDGTIYAIHWNQALHKLSATGTDQGIIDSETPTAVNVDPSTHHVYVAHSGFVREFDASGTFVNEFGTGLLDNTRGVDISGSTGDVYVSTNASGSKVIIFGPLAIVPDVTTGNATDVTGTSATLNGHVDPAGGGNISDCHFEYGTDTTYGNSVPCVPATPIASATDVSADISGLSPSTLYHFRLVAGNTVGSVLGADSTFAFSFLTFIDSFGSPGSGAGQFQTPVGVAVQESGGAIYVADSGNARVQKFNSKTNFIAAWGWGVADGRARSEICTSNCQAGIAGSGRGQFSNPRSIAVGNAPGPSKNKVFVGDWGNNTVLKFDADGNFQASIDGSNTPQGHFVDLRGVAVDQNGHLWIVDGANVNEFDAKGNFVQQWANPFGSSTLAIAVDSDNGAVYLTNGSGMTARFSLLGADQTTVDGASGTALALDAATGNLYVDHGNSVVVYDPEGTKLDEIFSLGTTTNSQGLAFLPSAGKKPGTLYISDATNDLVAIFAPQPPGPPFITAELARFAGTAAGVASETLKAVIVPMGFDTTCTFQFVSSADFTTSGYTNATTLPCDPANLGSSFDYQQASATAVGVEIGTLYHFRAIAVNSQGTTIGADQTFIGGPGAWTPFDRCPVDDPAMLATDGVTTVSICIASNSTHGSIQIGVLSPTATGNSNLQGGLVGDLNSGIFTFIPPTGGALVGDPVIVTVGSVSATATIQSAGTPTDFDLLAGLSVGMPILTLPTKIHLTNGSPVDLGPNCFIGSEVDPMVLHPANTDISGAMLAFDTFNPDGTIDPNGPLTALVVSGTVQGDDTFAVPVAQGCSAGLDPVINALVGLPSPSGTNHLVLNDASSALALPSTTMTGQQFANAWHTGFGQ